MNVDTLPNVHTARSEVSMFNALRDSTPSAMLLILVVKIYRLSYEAHYIVAEQLFPKQRFRSLFCKILSR